jgi:hypothetical protein
VLALDFDVDVDPLLASVARADLHETVHQAFAEFGILDDLGEFLVEEDVRLLPVDLGVRRRESRRP